MQVQTNEQIEANVLGLTRSRDSQQPAEARARAEQRATCGDRQS